MLFNSGSFLCFLLLVLPTYWLLPSNFLRKLLLVGTSFVFYGWWDWRVLRPLMFVILSVFFGARLVVFERTKGKPGRGLLYFWCCPGIEPAVFGSFKDFKPFADNFPV